MFGIDAPEFLVIAIVAIIVIGPKDLPLALRTAGRWMGKVRKVSGHFRSGIEAMIREAELEEMEKKWQEQNRKVMDKFPGHEMTSATESGMPEAAEVETPAAEPASAEAKAEAAKPEETKPEDGT